MQANKRLAIGAAILAVLVILGGYAVARARQAERQANVAARGSSVMPFDLERTTHVFEARGDGGVQTVTADDPADAVQVGLIREHLQKEAELFRRGDFSDPASIHGSAMPGLAELQAGAARIQVAYAPLPAGGQITYTSDDQRLIEALHAWFAAQLADHGRHASDHQMP